MSGRNKWPPPDARQKPPLRADAKAPPMQGNREEEQHREELSIAEAIVQKNNAIVNETQDIANIQRTSTQQLQRVLHATGALTDAAMETALVATTTSRGGGDLSSNNPQVSSSKGTIKISQPTPTDSKVEALQSLLVHTAGQAVPLAINILLLKSGVEAPAGTTEMLSALLLQAAGAGVAALTLNLPYWLGKKQVQKNT